MILGIVFLIVGIVFSLLTVFKDKNLNEKDKQNKTRALFSYLLAIGLFLLAIIIKAYEFTLF